MDVKTKSEIVLSIANEEIFKMEYVINIVLPRESLVVYDSTPDDQRPVYELEILKVTGKQGKKIDSIIDSSNFSLQKTPEEKNIVIYKKTPIYDFIKAKMLVSAYALSFAICLEKKEIPLDDLNLDQIRDIIIKKYNFDIWKKN